jgi:hypothetical protein
MKSQGILGSFLASSRWSAIEVLKLNVKIYDLAIHQNKRVCDLWWMGGTDLYSNSTT